MGRLIAILASGLLLAACASPSRQAALPAGASVSTGGAAEMVAGRRGERPKLGILYGNVAHDNELYGVLGVYLRLKGIVPPSTARFAPLIQRDAGLSKNRTASATSDALPMPPRGTFFSQRLTPSGQLS